MPEFYDFCPKNIFPEFFFFLGGGGEVPLPLPSPTPMSGDPCPFLPLSFPSHSLYGPSV